jgi:hypothetical protein
MLCSTPYQSGPLQPFQSLAGVLDQLAPATARSPSMAPPAKAAADLDQARRSLVNAWGTELLLGLSGEVASDEELVRLVNNWAVVQTYYAGYHAIQALIAARGHRRPEDHARTQSQFATSWADRPLQLPPWSLASCDGGWKNPCPQGIDDTISPWSACDPWSCWNLASKALRTTRDEKVAESLSRERDRQRIERKRSWHAEEGSRIEAGKNPRQVPEFSRPRLSQADKIRVAGKVRSFTILDYLYRLRIKTNYEDAGMFLEGPDDEFSSRRVHQDLVQIAACTMLVHELHVGAIVGKATLIEWVDEWVARNGANAALGLRARRDLLIAHLR